MLEDLVSSHRNFSVLFAQHLIYGRDCLKSLSVGGEIINALLQGHGVTLTCFLVLLLFERDFDSHESCLDELILSSLARGLPEKVMVIVCSQDEVKI